MMKFVQKDRGESSENSSGGGLDGFFKEIGTMFLAYMGMIVSMVIAGLVIVLIALWVISRI
jgi:hypothetical protein